MNTLHIIGNLTANPEARVIQGANGPNTVCNFTVAVNRIVKGQRVTEYFRVALWNKQADNAMKYLSKGRQVAVTGPVTGRAYQSQDGQLRYSLEIQDVREIQYLGMKPEGGAPAPEAAQDDLVPADDPDMPF